MTRFLRSVSGWLGRHALASVAAAVVAVAAAGGGVTYALASHGGATGAAAAAVSPSPGRAPATHHGHSSAHGAIADLIALLTRDTGQSLASIRSQLQGGKSLDQIAGAGAARFETDVLAQIKARADKAVAAKRLTAAQETAVLAKAKTMLDKAMAEPGTTLLQQLGHLGDGLHHSRPSPSAGASAA